MTVLNIYSLDDTEQHNIIACLPEGEHVIGRGGILQVSDKRVSRKHALITVTEDKITLTSVHVNPCFFKAFNGNNLTVITENQENELNDGDQFALLPDNYWFRVTIKREEPQPNGKRLHDHEMDKLETDEHVDAKKARLSVDLDATNENEPSTSKTAEASLNNTLHDNKAEEETNSSLQFQETARIEDLAEDEMIIEVKEEPIIALDSNLTTEINEESKDNKQGTSTGIKEEEAQVTTDINQSLTGNTIQGQNSDNGSNNPKRRRERCWYGDRCFRKNPNHRQNFSHPGEPDYQSDPDDDRPDCPFGAVCYRKNIDHRQEYKHSAPPAPRPTTNAPPAPPNTQNPAPTKKKPRNKAKTPAYDDESDEDYDYNDPFINDGSSDDFAPSDSNGSDSDWEDSQEVEESQDRKRMLNEAKKFTRNKRKKN